MTVTAPAPEGGGGPVAPPGPGPAFVPPSVGFPGDGGGDGGGTIETDDPNKEKQCQECLQAQNEEFNAKVEQLSSDFQNEIIFGCTAAAIGAGISVNGALVWLNAIPVMGTAAIEVIATIVGSGTYIACINNRYTRFVSDRAAAKAAWERNKVACGCK